MNIKILAPSFVFLLSFLAQAVDENAQKVVEQYLVERNAVIGRAHTMAILDETLNGALPGYVCFSVWFAQYPLAISAPEPLKSANILVVKDGTVKVITDAADLEKLFKSSLKPVTSASEAKAAVYAWLRLSQELHQDGFLKFHIPGKDLAGDTLEATGKSIVDSNGGNQGELSVALRFKEGKLISVEEKDRIRPGIRPICQATKLTDADPIVQKMA